MNYSALFIVAGIIIYGVLEYQRREAVHRDIMDHMKNGQIPQETETPRPELWKLFTTGGVGLVLLAVVVGLVIFGMKGHNYAKPYYSMASGFGLMLAMVALMFIRDVRSYTSSRRG